MSDGRGIVRSTLAAVAAGAAALAVFVAIAWPGLDGAYAGIDFNAALFEDFLGPYWNAATSLARGESAPAPGYLYPAFGAWVLAPATALGAGAASWICAALMLASAALLVASAFVLRPPATLRGAAAFGVAAFLAQPVVHGAYWGQASLPVLALCAAAFAAWSRGWSVLGGALVGVAAAVKLTPLVLLAAPLAVRDRRALAAAAGAFVACAALLPLALMGPTDFAAFHVEVGTRLREMSAWVATPDGGRGSQDLGALFARTFGASAWFLGRALGVVLTLALLFRAARLLNESPRAWGGAFVALAAIPWLVVGPTWPHGLAWVVVAWWLAWTSEGGRRTLAAASLALGSLVALRLVGDPGTYARIALPAASAGLAVLAMGTGPGPGRVPSTDAPAGVDGPDGA